MREAHTSLPANYFPPMNVYSEAVLQAFQQSSSEFINQGSYNKDYVVIATGSIGTGVGHLKSDLDILCLRTAPPYAKPPHPWNTVAQDYKLCKAIEDSGNRMLGAIIEENTTVSGYYSLYQQLNQRITQRANLGFHKAAPQERVIPALVERFLRYYPDGLPNLNIPSKPFPQIDKTIGIANLGELLSTFDDYPVQSPRFSVFFIMILLSQIGVNAIETEQGLLGDVQTQLIDRLCHFKDKNHEGYSFVHNGLGYDWKTMTYQNKYHNAYKKNLDYPKYFQELRRSGNKRGSKLAHPLLAFKEFPELETLRELYIIA